MQVDDDNNKANKAQDADATSPGQRLRSAREASGKSVDEVSHDLRLDRDVILALEADDLDGLGAPVFVKGYLRSYARLLQIPESDVVEVLVVTAPEPEEFRTLSAQRELKPGANMVNFFLWVALCLVVLLGATYLLLGDDPEPAGALDKGDFVVPEPQPAAPVFAEPQAPAEPAVPAEPEGAAGGQSSAVAPQAEPQAEPEPVIAAPAGVTMQLQFSEECWVEVSDSRRRLVYGLEKAGSDVKVEGIPPFKIFLGNVKAVELRVNDAAFAVPGAGSGKNTARFVIGVDDVPGGG